jgi:hypothetical protein
LLARGRWFSPGAPASSTTKTGRHDIAESDVKHQKSNQPVHFCYQTLTTFNKVTIISGMNLPTKTYIIKFNKVYP